MPVRLPTPCPIVSPLNDVWSEPSIVASGQVSQVPTNWVEVLPAGTPPSARFGHTGLYDSSSNRMMVFGGATSLTSCLNDFWTLDDANSAQAQFEDLQSGPGVMVQKFMDTIIDEGEWSLIFFDGEFSHAILKTPKPGDFRVQNDFGGSERPADPPAQVLHSATGIVQTVAPALYARVDGVVDGNQFRLMELELIEPMLFLSSHPQAPARFSDAIARKL